MDTMSINLFGHHIWENTYQYTPKKGTTTTSTLSSSSDKEESSAMYLTNCHEPCGTFFYTETR